MPPPLRARARRRPPAASSPASSSASLGELGEVDRELLARFAGADLGPPPGEEGGADGSMSASSTPSSDEASSDEGPRAPRWHSAGIRSRGRARGDWSSPSTTSFSSPSASPSPSPDGRLAAGPRARSDGGGEPGAEGAPVVPRAGTPDHAQAFPVRAVVGGLAPAPSAGSSRFTGKAAAKRAGRQAKRAAREEARAAKRDNGDSPALAEVLAVLERFSLCESGDVASLGWMAKRQRAAAASLAACFRVRLVSSATRGAKGKTETLTLVSLAPGRRPLCDEAARAKARRLLADHEARIVAGRRLDPRTVPPEERSGLTAEEGGRQRTGRVAARGTGASGPRGAAARVGGPPGGPGLDDLLEGPGGLGLGAASGGRPRLDARVPGLRATFISAGELLSLRGQQSGSAGREAGAGTSQDAVPSNGAGTGEKATPSNGAETGREATPSSGVASASGPSSEAAPAGGLPPPPPASELLLPPSILDPLPGILTGEAPTLSAADAAGVPTTDVLLPPLGAAGPALLPLDVIEDAAPSPLEANKDVAPPLLEVFEDAAPPPLGLAREDAAHPAAPLYERSRSAPRSRPRPRGGSTHAFPAGIAAAQDAPQGPPEIDPPRHEFAAFERHTRGVASKLMAKWGFAGEGAGLGRQESGRAHPIVADRRAKGRGLGA